MGAADGLYERFDKNLQAVNGNSWLCSVGEAADVIVKAYKEAGIGDACLVESPLVNEIGVKDALEKAGITVYTDHIRLHSETAKGGICEVQCGIADLGSVLQLGDNIDSRLVAGMSEYYIGIVKLSSIVEDYDAMFDQLCAMKELPSFVGFITGPSRTADIECVSTVGVHGPLKLSIVVIADI
ncbi:MAG: lactate utilization protein C [Lachnospiraceae bacterium]|nr:lactate utilization protein C [Lachnospiraceae bacterium]